MASRGVAPSLHSPMARSARNSIRAGRPAVRHCRFLLFDETLCRRCSLSAFPKPQGEIRHIVTHLGHFTHRRRSAESNTRHQAPTGRMNFLLFPLFFFLFLALSCQQQCYALAPHCAGRYRLHPPRLQLYTCCAINLKLH